MSPLVSILIAMFGPIYIDGSHPRCSDSRDRVSAMSSDTPWCSPAALDESRSRRVKPGDIICVKGGDYTIKPIRLYSVGFKDKPITIAALPGATVTIRGSSLKYESLITFGVGANYWTLDGFNIVGYEKIDKGRLYIPKLIDAQQSTGHVLRNLTLGPVQGKDDIGFGFRWSNQPTNESWACVVQWATMNECLVDNVTILGIDSPANVVIDRNASDGLLMDNCKANVIRNSCFGDCGHVALDLRNSPVNVIEHNLIENRLHTGAAIINIPGNAGDSTGNIFRHNIVRRYNESPSYSTIGGIGLQILHAGDNLVCDNLIHDGGNDATGISVSTDPTRGRADRNRVYHNTIYRPGGRGVEIGHFGPAASYCAASDNEIIHNLILCDVPPGDAPNALSRSAPVALTLPDLEKSGTIIRANMLRSIDGIGIRWRDENAKLRMSLPVTEADVQTTESGCP